MPGCKDIEGLELDQDSRIALADIKRKKALYKYLKVAMLGGTLMNILNGRSRADFIMNIKTTDFQALHQALSGAGLAERGDLLNIA